MTAGGNVVRNWFCISTFQKINKYMVIKMQVLNSISKKTTNADSKYKGDRKGEILKYFPFILILLLFGNPLRAADIWVSPSGNDNNEGTRQEPLATVRMAFRKARNLRRLNDPSIKDGINIYLTGGEYCLDEPLLLRPEDSGTGDSPTVVQSAPGENAEISGGVRVDGWQKVRGNVPGLPKAAIGNAWVADIPEIGGRRLEFRQLWVNGQKASRASNLTDGVLERILSVDKQKEILWIPKPDFSIPEIGQLEFVIHQWWAIANLRVKDIKVVGDSAAVTFHQPESRIEFEHPWPAPFIDEKKDKNGNSAFYFVSAIELLNKPGEWYEDLNNGKVYYWPRKGENLKKDRVVVPYLETLVRIEGSLDHPVSHVQFGNISFKHTTWLRPSKAGHVPLQAGFYLLDAYKLKIPGTKDKKGLENQAWLGRQPAAVEVQGANNIVFEGCTFEHMAAAGLDFVAGTNHDMVQGCVFTDIGGTALQAGYFGDAGFEAHLPYDPEDGRVVCHHETFVNNYIHNVTNEDWGCVGICAGFVHNVTISHNEICDINYSGISVGWGWTKTVNCMKNNYVFANHIHHFAQQMYDVGGIYTLAAQPNTELRGNSIHDLMEAPYAHDPNHFQYIYFDENSSYIRAIDNWTEKDKFFSNSPGPGNEWTNNGPQVADSIKNNAGLEAKYKDLLLR
jgi:hypothetical protein